MTWKEYGKAIADFYAKNAKRIGDQRWGKPPEKKRGTKERQKERDKK